MADLSNEINQMMGQSCYAVPDDVDEEELMGELDALEEDLAAEPGMGSGPSYLQVRLRACSQGGVVLLVCWSVSCPPLLLPMVGPGEQLSRAWAAGHIKAASFRNKMPDTAASPGVHMCAVLTVWHHPASLQEPDLSDLPAAPQQEAEEELNLPAAPAMKT